MERDDEFAEFFQAAHPYLDESERAVLVDLVTLWVNKKMAAGQVAKKPIPDQLSQRVGR